MISKPPLLQTDTAVIEAKTSEEKYIKHLFESIDYTAEYLWQITV